MRGVSENAIALRFKRPLWTLAILLVSVACRGISPWLHINRINTSDFEDVRTTISAYTQELFDEAGKEFADGDYWYEPREGIARELSYEESKILDVHIVQFPGNDGSLYEVLFVYTSRVRGFGGGYYYTPSGNLPPWAPTYGVVCSKHLEDHWYAFNTVDSRTPPSSKNCPEDIQYSSTNVPTD